MNILNCHNVTQVSGQTKRQAENWVIKLIPQTRSSAYYMYAILRCRVYTYVHGRGTRTICLHKGLNTRGIWKGRSTVAYVVITFKLYVRKWKYFKTHPSSLEVGIFTATLLRVFTLYTYYQTSDVCIAISFSVCVYVCTNINVDSF